MGESAKLLELVVIGTSHAVQHETWAGFRGSDKLLSEAREQYARNVGEIFTRHQIECIAEEAHRKIQTIASRLTECWRNVTAQPWWNSHIDAPEEGHANAQTQCEIEIFEAAFKFFRNRQSGMLILGAVHLQPLADRFRSSGAEVIAIDHREQPWWHGDLE
jgi:hypothetical protein